MTAPSPGSTVHTSAQRRPEIVKAMLTPWRAIVSPRSQSSPLADCSRFSFWTTFVLHALVFVAMIIVLILWSETVTLSWIKPLAAAGGIPARDMHELTWSQAWTSWTNQPWGPGPFVSALMLAGAVFSGHVVLAWLFLPDVHEGGSVARSFGRAFRGVAGAMGMLIAISAVFGVTVVLLDRDGMYRGDCDWEMYATMAGFALAGVQIAWIRRTCEGARRAADAPELPPMCEDCGYDLTHRPESGRCTECGGDINASLTAGARRNTCMWEQRGGEASIDPSSRWILRLGGVVSSVILESVRFYRGLVMRSNLPRAVSFSRWQYVGIGGAAWLWVIISGALIDNLSGMGFVWVPAIFGMIATWLAWLIHRTVGAIALSYCFVRGMLPDPRYARKVFAYEAAFLWVFCLYDGFLMTTIFLWDAWMSDLLGVSPPWLGGMPPELAAIFFGNAAIVIGWLYRYRLIIPQVRWANY